MPLSRKRLIRINEALLQCVEGWRDTEDLYRGLGDSSSLRDSVEIFLDWTAEQGEAGMGHRMAEDILISTIEGYL